MWEVQFASRDSSLDELLRASWEPFAAMKDTHGGTILCLRRQVPESPKPPVGGWPDDVRVATLQEVAAWLRKQYGKGGSVTVYYSHIEAFERGEMP